MLLEIDLLHAEIRLIDTHDSDVQEWAICVDGCTLEEICAHLSDDYPACEFIHACQYALSRFDIPNTGDLTHVPIRERPLRFLPYARAAVLHDLNKLGGNLHVSDTFATGKMHRTAQYAQDTDRFISINQYRNGEKKGSDIINTPFLMCEIDDDEIPTQVDTAREWAPEIDLASILVPIAERHIRTAQKAISHLCREEVPPPFYVCYTGNRSIHMLWRFDTPLCPLQKAQIDALKKSKVEAAKKAKAIGAMSEWDEAIDSVDPEPMFSSVALVRIPCDVPEWSPKLFKHRYPQIAWHVTDSPTEPNRDVLNSSAMFSYASEHIRIRLVSDTMISRFTYRTKADRQPLRNVTQAEVEGALGKA